MTSQEAAERELASARGEPPFSLLLVSLRARLSLVAVAVAALWLAVYWALT